MSLASFVRALLDKWRAIGKVSEARKRWREAVHANRNELHKSVLLENIREHAAQRARQAMEHAIEKQEHDTGLHRAEIDFFRRIQGDR